MEDWILRKNSKNEEVKGRFLDLVLRIVCIGKGEIRRRLWNLIYRL